MKTNNKILAITAVLAVAMAGIVGISLQSEESEAGILASGQVGTINWVVDTDGVLTLSGTGEIVGYTETVRPPWYNYSANITTVIVNEGITKISGAAFGYLTKVKNVFLPKSMTSIGTYPFYGVDSVIFLSMSDTTAVAGHLNYNSTLSFVLRITAYNSSKSYVLNTYIKNWQLAYATDKVTKLLIDTVDPASLTNVTPTVGKSVQISAISVNTTGGNFYAADGVTLLTGADRAGKNYLPNAALTGWKHDGTAGTNYFNTVSFDANGGTGSMTSLQVFNTLTMNLPLSTFTPPADTIFIGWKVENTGSTMLSGTQFMPTGNVKLYAQWETTITQTVFTITYDLGVASGSIPPKTVVEGSGVILANPMDYTFPPVGKIFGGWKIVGTNTTINAGTLYTPIANTTLLAVWNDSSGGGGGTDLEETRPGGALGVWMLPLVLILLVATALIAWRFGLITGAIFGTAAAALVVMSYFLLVI